MRTYKNKTIIRQVIDAMTCDVCKKEYGDPLELQEFILIDKLCGYKSVFGDSSAFEFDICQHCFHELFSDKVRVVDEFQNWGDF